jgi:hypothetical protein
MNERKQVREVSWKRLFACELAPPKVEASVTVKKCRCGNGNCRTAKRILCTCSCHSTNHGAANRAGVESLDKSLGLDKTDMETLGSQPEILRLDPQTSGELIYIA